MMGLRDWLRARYADDDYRTVDALAAPPKADRTWGGQGFCSTCGKATISTDIFPDRPFDSYTGEKRPRLGVVVHCPDAVDDWSKPPRAYLNSFTTASTLFYGLPETNHDYWVVKER